MQIISPEVFEKAQEISKERAADYADRRIPLNTKGNALLSGNVFCGHCGARLTLTTNGKKYIRKDGEATITPKTRYVCYNKTRHPEKCDGQTVSEQQLGLDKEYEVEQKPKQKRRRHEPEL